jgi:hypothetical protein
MDIIVDIDGTLADCTHRLHHIQKRPKDWDAFFAATAGDQPIMPVIAMVSCMRAHPGNKIIFCSGRPERTRTATEGWLRRHCLPMGPLYMRGDHDRRDDDILKRDLLARIRGDGFDPVLAIDDRRRVVDMWRAEGLICAQVAAGDF